MPTTKTLETSSTRLVLANYDRWEGDDMRWSSKAMRRWQRRMDFSRQPVRNTLVLLNIGVFFYQVLNSVRYVISQYPEIWPGQAVPLVFDTLMGSTRPGPFTADFVHLSALSKVQPHRYLTSGFLHGSLLHLFLNMDAMGKLPGWLETGLGRLLFLTTFLAAVVTGNMAHTFVTSELDRTFCLGASGGICGLYGLLYTQLVRMGNDAAAWRVMKGMVILVGYGMLSSNISNAGHVGGFIGGVVIALLCGPRYHRSYSLRRKNSLTSDAYSRDYRTAMGYDKLPSERGIVPLPLLWLGLGIVAFTQPNIAAIPQMIWKGVSAPGTLSQVF